MKIRKVSDAEALESVGQTRDLDVQLSGTEPAGLEPAVHEECDAGARERDQELRHLGTLEAPSPRHYAS